MNKLFKSKIALGLYIVAALLGILFLIMLISSISYISNYAASYGVGIGDLGGEAITYILGNSINYLIYGIVVFAAGRILDVVTEIKAGAGCDSAANSTAGEASKTADEDAESVEGFAAEGADELPAKGPVPPLYTERSIFNY